MKSGNRTRGQSIIEFALLFPLLFFMITGLFDLGRAVVYLSALNSAVREGTRWTIVQPKNTITPALVESHMRSLNFYGINDLATNSTITPVFVYAAEDPTITITATYNFVPITPGMKELLGSGTGIPLKAESTMLLTPVSK
ncbi:MAG: TadE/TadG family type IV pilus assembly protein [Anaerolineaceae bacterium]